MSSSVSLTHQAAYSLSVGARSPWHHSDISDVGGASLVLDASAPILVVVLPRPTFEERRTFEQGRLQFGLVTEGCSGVFMAKLHADGGADMILEAPFHVGRERGTAATTFEQSFEIGVAPSFILIMQDEEALIQVIRNATLPRTMFTAIGNLIQRQRQDLLLPGFERRHRAALGRFNSRYQSTSAAFEAAVVL